MTWTKALAAILCGALSSSCVALVAGAAAGIGYVSYDENEAVRDFDASLDDTWEATLASMQAMGYPVSDSFPHGTTEGEIDLEDREINVKVEMHPEGFTRVRVRIGTFDSEDHQRRAGLLLNGIAERL